METEPIPDAVVYAVIWEDRHTDTEVTLFADVERAIEWAKGKAREYNRHGDLNEELTEPMRQVGWLYYGCYSSEGDCLWVIPSTVQ